MPNFRHLLFFAFIEAAGAARPLNSLLVTML